jgi:hypothetical protein
MKKFHLISSSTYIQNIITMYDNPYLKPSLKDLELELLAFLFQELSSQTETNEGSKASLSKRWVMSARGLLVLLLLHFLKDGTFTATGLVFFGGTGGGIFSLLSWRWW